MTTTPFSGLMNDAASRLATIEAQVLQATKLNLLQKVAGVWTQADDDLFASHTAYCIDCWNYGVPDLASRFWESTLSHETAAADSALSKQTPSSRIHKGAPFYNTGRGYLLAGNLDKAIAFISEAGKEEALRGIGSVHGLLLGNHGLTEEAILTPLIKWITDAKWEAVYSSVTARSLDLAELKCLITWLCSKPENAVQLIVCLLRLKSLESTPQNDGVRHLRVQGLADFLLVVESSMRVWQVGAAVQNKQLYGRLQEMLSPVPVSKSAFGKCEAEYGKQFTIVPPATAPALIKETAAAVNWILQDNLSRLSNATSTAERAGVVCHLIARLRNSLMHVIDDSINLYTDDAMFTQVSALILSAIRLSQSGSDGTISALPTS